MKPFGSNKIDSWLRDDLSDKVSQKLGDMPSLKKMIRGTIGVAGHYPINNANLNIALVKKGNEKGYADDQDHPETVTINLTSDSSFEALRDQIRMLADIGCDLIAIPEYGLTEEQVKFLQQQAPGREIIKIFKDETFETFADRVLNSLENKVNKIRPDIFDNSNYNDTIKSLSQDLISRKERVQYRRENDGGYPKIKSILENQPVVGIVGGAGPMASADYSYELANRGIPHINFSNSAAPYKIRFALKEGLSFLPHYKNTISALQEFGCNQIAFPCNTMHLFLDVFKDSREFSSLNFVDIREAVADSLKKFYNKKKIIVLGTEATSGVFTKNSEVSQGLYDKILEKNGHKIIKPDFEQQKMINEAIFFSKAGNKEEAKEKVKIVVEQLKEEHGSDSTVGLLCTDLPIIFDVNEINALNAISSIQALVSYTEKECEKFKDNVRKKTNSKRSIEEENQSSKRARFASGSNDGSLSDQEQDDNFSVLSNYDDNDKLSEILEKYNLSYESGSNRKEVRVQFQLKDKDSNINKHSVDDLEKFAEKFRKGGVTTRVHRNSGYITFIGSNSEKESLKELKDFLTKNNSTESSIKSNQTTR